jgi:hypothetical protein
VTRDSRFSAVLVGVGLTLGLFGYFVGHSGAPTDTEIAKARTAATTSAKKTAAKRAFTAGRSEGRAAGRREGRSAGAAKGTKDGKKKVKETQAGTGTIGTGAGTGGTGTGQDYSQAPLNGSTTTPPANSDQGQKLLDQSPDCKNVPPPPPDYHGPVQC